MTIGFLGEVSTKKIWFLPVNIIENVDVNHEVDAEFVILDNYALLTRRLIGRSPKVFSDDSLLLQQ